MYSILFLMTTVCCAVFYLTSTKIKFGNIGNWRSQLLSHKKLARGSAILVLSIIAFVLCQDLGPASGIFSFFAILMTACSLLVLLYPYHHLQWTHLGLLFFLCLVLEFTYRFIGYAGQ